MNLIIRTGGFHPEIFKKWLDKEVHGQLMFFAEVLEAMPKVYEEVDRLMRRGKYPIVEFVRT